MNNTPRKKVVIGSRESNLAMIQSRHIQSLLSASHPDIEFIIETSSSHGDDNQNVPLSVVGASNPGLFTKSLEVHITTGRYDLAVHSLKDMPTTLPDGLTLSAITTREDPTDALVLHPQYNLASSTIKTLADLPKGAIIGTSSLRRQALIHRYHPHLTVVSIRGNLNTRLAKLDQSTILLERENVDGETKKNTTTTATTASTTASTEEWIGEPNVHYDAIVLATAGLIRMGWKDRISETLHLFQYGISQGALGIETRKDDEWMNALVGSTLSDYFSTVRCLCERSFLRTLQGGCQVPIGATTTLTEVEGGDQLLLKINGIVLGLDGQKWVEGNGELLIAKNGTWKDLNVMNAVEKVGSDVAEITKTKGADELLGRGDARPITYSEVATDQ